MKAPATRRNIPFLTAQRRLFETPTPPLRGGFLAERIWYPAVGPQQEITHGSPVERYRLYSLDELKAIRDEGFTSVWLYPGALRDLIRTRVFPDLGQGQVEHQRALDRVLADCERAGLGLYLYFLEPAYLREDHPLFKQHPDIMGDLPETDVHPSLKPKHPFEVALCTSTRKVQDFIHQGFQGLAQRFPGLRGTIHITATERLTHCWSHAWYRVMEDCRCFHPDTRRPTCPRCAKREPEEVIGELAGLFEKAIHSVDKRMRVIIWNWDWVIYQPDPQASIVRALPKKVTFMSDFERGSWKESFGERFYVDEYSLSTIGPSAKFTESTALARQGGRDVFAKLQIGASHEMGSIPNLPLIANVQQKLVGLYRLGVNGAMATWDFGCARSLNTYVFNRFCDDPRAGCDQDVFLRQMAREYFGGIDADAVVQAWRYFCQSFDLYPFSQRFTYYSPIHNAPAYPLRPDYRGAPMDRYYNQDFGDRMRDTLVRFTWEGVIARMAEMERLWRQGLALYAPALAAKGGTAVQRRHRFEELSVARMIPVHLRGTWNAYRLHAWKVRKAGCELWDKPHRFRLDTEGRAIMADEIRNARSAIPLVEADPRLGLHFEAPNPLYTVPMIRGKIRVMQQYR